MNPQHSSILPATNGTDVLLHTDFPPLQLHKRGKVRDIYKVDGYLLIVATDRISAFDVVLPTGIPDKGRALTELSRPWFTRTAGPRGIIIADTKFEFGFDEGTGRLILIDEVLTPDSSRFWPKDDSVAGRPQPSFDKQFVRDYLESLGWDKRPPAPPLPDEIVVQTRARYLEALRRLTDAAADSP